MLCISRHGFVENIAGRKLEMMFICDYTDGKIDRMINLVLIFMVELSLAESSWLLETRVVLLRLSSRWLETVTVLLRLSSRRLETELVLLRIPS